MRTLRRDILAFFKGHWPHILIGIPAAVAFTALHEIAHCIPVWLQGGHVTEFAWLPSGEEWGHMQFSFPPQTEYSSAAVSLSPYALGVAWCLLAGLLSLRRSAWSFRWASTIFVWMFIAPLADIANAAVPYLLSDSSNDFRQAFGPMQPPFLIAAISVGIIALISGFLLNKRLYRERAVGLPAYGCLAAAAALAVLVISS
jgi:hypothetical protein